MLEFSEMTLADGRLGGCGVLVAVSEGGAAEGAAGLGAGACRCDEVVPEKLMMVAS